MTRLHFEQQWNQRIINWILAQVKIFSIVQTGSGAHPASSPVGTSKSKKSKVIPITGHGGL
jgi:hypothetical protein